MTKYVSDREAIGLASLADDYDVSVPKDDVFRLLATREALLVAIEEEHYELCKRGMTIEGARRDDMSTCQMNSHALAGAVRGGK